MAPSPVLTMDPMLLILLADTTSSTATAMFTPVALASWVAIAVFLIGGANQVGKLMDRFRDRPPTTELRAELVDRFVDRETFQRHAEEDVRRMQDVERALGDLRTELVEQERRAADAQDRRLADIHSRVNDVLRAVSELKGRVDARPPGGWPMGGGMTT